MIQNIRQALTVAAYNFRQWRGNPRIGITFALSYILCFLLSDRAVTFAERQGTAMQILEPFIWTFGDSSSILLSSLLLIFLFSDMPFLSAGTPFFLVRTRRSIWLVGQMLYVSAATLLYMAFTMAATVLLCMKNSFAGNLWSPTAVILGYADTSFLLPASRKTMEMTTPYSCAAVIFLLMLLYALVMVFFMMVCNLWRGQAAGVVGAIVFSVYGFLLQPQTFISLFQLSEAEHYKANVAVGWLSPLNQATYPMHSFGYDLLPRLWQTYVISGLLLALLVWAARRIMKKYSFSFTGTEM